MGDANSDLRIRITEGCPSERALNAAARATFEHSAIQTHLEGTRFRLLSLETPEPPDKTHNPVLPERYRATVYDYTNNRSLLVEGALADPGNVEVTVSGAQPLPTDEEFDAAVAILPMGIELCEKFELAAGIGGLPAIEIHGRLGRIGITTGIVAIEQPDCDQRIEEVARATLVIAARHRLAIGEAAAEDALFLPYGAPAQEEARISAEELNTAAFRLR